LLNYLQLKGKAVIPLTASIELLFLFFHNKLTLVSTYFRTGHIQQKKRPKSRFQHIKL
jgi:hypothetical protein